MIREGGALFLTQGRSIRLFADMAADMAKRSVAARAGFYVTDSATFRVFSAERPGFATTADIVKEWEALNAARHKPADRARVAALETRYGETLWNAVVADRRLSMGPKAVREQDYATRYSDDELLSIVVSVADEMEALFDRVRPDFVVGFICVTVGEYIAQLIARARGIPMVDLRPTRIRNYFYGGEDIFEPSPALGRAYDEYRSNGVPEEARAQAAEIIAAVRGSHAMYEGVLPAKGQAVVADTIGPAVETGPGRETLAGRLQRIVRELWAYNFGALRADNHHAGRFSAHWFHRVKKPCRTRAIKAFLARRYVRDLPTLGRRGYAFFPLHKEPEVTLLVYGRAWRNQIEAVRNIARALPAGMTLLVKEHPAAIGYRPLGYYRKLLEIPGVRLAAPETTSRDILNHAKLVTIIGGSVGLEALMLRLPVLALGEVPFSFLPDGMIRTSRDTGRIGDDIAALLDNGGHDEAALEAYVAAVIENSVAVDFYSVLLGRGGGIYRPDGGGSAPYATQLGQLADYTIMRAAHMACRDEKSIAGNE